MYFPYEETFIFMIIYYIFSLLEYFLAPRLSLSKSNNSKEIHSYYCLYNAFIHSFITSILVVIKIFQEGIKDGDKPSNFSYIILAHSQGYFMHDFVKNHLFASVNLTSELHHYICLFGFATTLTNDYGGTEISNGMLLAESSNIFLKIRIMLKIFNLKSNKFYFINEIIFAIDFVLMRMIIGPIYTFSWIFHLKTPLVTLLFGFLLSFVSVIWIEEIVLIIGLKIPMNTKYRLLLFFKKFTILLKESRTVKALYYIFMIVPQIIIIAYLYITLRIMS